MVYSLSDILIEILQQKYDVLRVKYSKYCNCLVLIFEAKIHTFLTFMLINTFCEPYEL